MHAKRYPLSGASREVKARKNGAGFTTLENWLSDYDALFLKRNNTTPLVVLPWRTWQALIVRSAK